MIGLISHYAQNHSRSLLNLLSHYFTLRMRKNYFVPIFVDDLDGHDILGVTVFGLVDLAKLTLAEHTTYKVVVLESDYNLRMLQKLLNVELAVGVEAWDRHFCGDFRIYRTIK